MNYRLRDYIEDLFKNAPRVHKVYDLKDELLMNLTDKYNDLIENGKNEEEAFRIVTSSIGDINELLQGIGEVAITEDTKEQRKKTALIVSISVILYILSVTVLILTEEVLGISSEIGVVIMLTIASIPTGLLIYHFMSIAKEDKSLGNFNEWQDYRNGKHNSASERDFGNWGEWQESRIKNKKIMDNISSIMWTVVTGIYLWHSFMFGTWAYSWIIFIVGAAIQNSIKLVLELKENNNKKTYEHISSILWTLTTAIYLWVSFALGIWGYSWIIFIIGTAIQNIIKLTFQLKEQ